MSRPKPPAVIFASVAVVIGRSKTIIGTTRIVLKPIISWAEFIERVATQCGMSATFLEGAGVTASVGGTSPSARVCHINLLAL